MENNTLLELPKTDFFEYIEKIRSELIEIAPEWEINMHLTKNPEKPDYDFLYYHLRQADFSNGEKNPRDFILNQSIFAYIQKKDGVDDYFIFSQSPIQIKK